MVSQAWIMYSCRYDVYLVTKVIKRIMKQSFL